MRSALVILSLLAVPIWFSGCATDSQPVSKKERERMDREMDRMNRKSQQEQYRTQRELNRDPMRTMRQPGMR